MALPLSLTNRFQAALLGSCLGPIGLMSQPEPSDSGLDPAWAIAQLETAAQRIGVPLAPCPDHSPVQDHGGPSPLGQPLQDLLSQLPGRLLALERETSPPAPTPILVRLLRGQPLAAIAAFPPPDSREIAAPPPLSGHDKAVLGSFSRDGLQTSQELARLALHLAPNHWALVAGQLRAIAQAQDLDPAIVVAAASWLGIWFGAAHGVTALPWRPQLGWGLGRSRLLSLGNRLYGHWAGQGDRQKVGVSWDRDPTVTVPLP